MASNFRNGTRGQSFGTGVVSHLHAPHLNFDLDLGLDPDLCPELDVEVSANGFAMTPALTLHCVRRARVSLRSVAQHIRRVRLRLSGDRRFRVAAEVILDSGERVYTSAQSQNAYQAVVSALRRARRSAIRKLGRSGRTRTAA